MDLASLLTNPTETRSVEYKQWLDLGRNDHRALLAKGLIALANFGGGRVVLGFKSIDHGALILCDEEAPGNHAVVYAPERVQQVIERYASHRFEVSCEYVERPDTLMTHPVIMVPANVREVIFPRYSSPDGSDLVKGRLYTRLPGPRSATPETPGDWAEFVDGLVRRRKDDILDLLNRAPPDTAPRAAGTVNGGTPPPQKRTVHDRMSNAPPPDTHPAPSRLVVDLLEPDELFVFENPVSEGRVTAFREGIRDALDRSMPIFRLFELAGTRARLQSYDERYVFGMTHVSFKGPFVERSSWAEVREYQFALAIDEFLRKQWAELLVARAADAPMMGRDVDAMQEFVGGASDSVRHAGGQPDLVVIIEPEGDDVDQLFMHERSWWGTPSVIRGADVRDVTFVRGQIGGLPVLQIHGAPVDRALVTVLDLADYELILTDVDGDKDDYLELTVIPLTAREAQEWVLKAPEVRESLFRSKHHREGAYSTEEAAARLQLMARYRLWAAGEVRERHRPRAVHAWLDSAPSVDGQI